jgi:hypothetical protein
MRKLHTKLTVRRETIRAFAKQELRDAVGGVYTTCTVATAQASSCPVLPQVMQTGQ